MFSTIIYIAAVSDLWYKLLISLILRLHVYTPMLLQLLYMSVIIMHDIVECTKLIVS